MVPLKKVYFSWKKTADLSLRTWYFSLTEQGDDVQELIDRVPTKLTQIFEWGDEYNAHSDDCVESSGNDLCGRVTDRRYS